MIPGSTGGVKGDRVGDHGVHSVTPPVVPGIIRFMSLRCDLSKVRIERAVADRNRVPSCTWFGNRIHARIIRTMPLRSDLSKVRIDAAAIHQFVVA